MSTNSRGNKKQELEIQYINLGPAINLSPGGPTQNIPGYPYLSSNFWISLRYFLWLLGRQNFYSGTTWQKSENPSMVCDLTNVSACSFAVKPYQPVDLKPKVPVAQTEQKEKWKPSVLWTSAVHLCLLWSWQFWTKLSNNGTYLFLHVGLSLRRTLETTRSLWKRSHRWWEKDYKSLFSIKKTCYFLEILSVL